MPKETLHIQSQKSRIRVINLFCLFIAVFSTLLVGVYLVMGANLLSALNAFIASLFFLFLYLNKKGYQEISRSAIIITTNIGIIAFSIILGFHTGVYMYLFVAPLLTYLLYDFRETYKVIATFASYLTTFFIIYYFSEDRIAPIYILDEKTIVFLNAYNLVVTLLLSFSIVAYFANNNAKYISELKDQHETLKKEIELRRESETLLTKSLNDREILLSEIHHRVKNNLAIISALLNLQIDKSQLQANGNPKDIFRETSNRIFAMSLIHNLLYHNKSFSNIDFKQFLKSLNDNVVKSYPFKQTISLKTDIAENCKIDLQTAIPLALILNELLTNCYKHAFKENQSGEIDITLNCPRNPNHFRLTFSDNGIGMSEHLVNQDTVGMTIINSLVEQIDGQISYTRDGGSHFEIVFIMNVPKVD